MRFLQAGDRQLVALEPEQDVIEDLVARAGFQGAVNEKERSVVVEVKPNSEKEPILLFEANDPANLGWFSRCHFYVDGHSGAVLQTPLTVANCRDSNNRLLPMLRISLAKELPASFRLPGKEAVSEAVVYRLLYNFLLALRESGVAICGRGGILPLAGGQPPTDPPGGKQAPA